jgi:hypothetical protein
VGEIYFFQLWTPSQATISKINLKSIKSSSIIMASTSLEKWNIHVASFGAGNQIRCQSSVYEFTLWVSQRPKDLRVENFEALSGTTIGFNDVRVIVGGVLQGRK